MVRGFKTVTLALLAMKHIRITARPDLDRSPPFVAYLLESPAVTEAKAIDWNRADATTTSHLYGIDGDVNQFADAARETPGVASVTLAASEDPRSYAMLDVRDDAVPMFGVVEEALARAGIVIRRPLVYRNKRIHGHVVGDATALQAVLDTAPDTMNIQIDEIGRFPSARANPASKLSDRQWEALEAARELGYYNQPREATHDDIAERLDCAPNTAGQHLQKAEAKLVEAVMGDVALNI